MEFAQVDNTVGIYYDDYFRCFCFFFCLVVGPAVISFALTMANSLAWSYVRFFMGLGFFFSESNFSLPLPGSFESFACFFFFALFASCMWEGASRKANALAM